MKTAAYAAKIERTGRKNMERNENGLSELLQRGGGRGSCSMGGGTTHGLGQRQLAMVYAPMQCFRMLYDHDDALMAGTLFEELYKPYEVEW